MPQEHHKANRIIVTGVGGAGKTTIVEALAPLLSLPVIPEVARLICKELGYQSASEAPDSQAFKEAVLTRQIELEEKHVAFISDRSTIDCWVQWQRWNICQAMTYDTESYYNRSRTQAQRYSHIIYVPQMFPPIDDGFRWTEPDYLKQMDRIIRSTLYDWDLWNRTYVVQSVSKEERVEEVLNWLQMSDGRVHLQER